MTTYQYPALPPAAEPLDPNSADNLVVPAGVAKYTTDLPVVGEQSMEEKLAIAKVFAEAYGEDPDGKGPETVGDLKPEPAPQSLLRSGVKFDAKGNALPPKLRIEQDQH